MYFWFCKTVKTILWAALPELIGNQIALELMSALYTFIHIRQEHAEVPLYHAHTEQVPTKMFCRRNSSLMSTEYIFDLMRRGNNISFHVEKKKSSYLSPADDVLSDFFTNQTVGNHIVYYLKITCHNIYMH